MSSRHKLTEITPIEFRCALGPACPAVYDTIELTPQEYRCFAGLGCPSINELKRLTPEDLQCGIGACPEVYEQNKDNYLIIGKIIDPTTFGLEKKVGEGEMLISISKAIIDGALKR